MSDPRFDYDRGIPPRDPDMGDKTTLIVGGVLSAVLVIGLIFYSMSGDTPKTAGTSPPETTGQSERVTPPAERVTPPANPNATEPQKDPPRAQ